MCCYRYNNNTIVYNVIYLPLTCQFLTHANSRAQSFLLLSGEGGRNPSGCISTRRLNKNFQNTALDSTKRAQSAFENIQEGFRLSSRRPRVNPASLLTPTVSNYDPLQAPSGSSASEQTAPRLRCTQRYDAAPGFLKPSLKPTSRKQAPSLLIFL